MKPKQWTVQKHAHKIEVGLSFINEYSAYYYYYYYYYMLATVVNSPQPDRSSKQLLLRQRISTATADGVVVIVNLYSAFM